MEQCRANSRAFLQQRGFEALTFLLSHVDISREVCAGGGVCVWMCGNLYVLLTHVSRGMAVRLNVMGVHGCGKHAKR